MVLELPTNLCPHLVFKHISRSLNLGDLKTARQLFDRISQPDLRSWTLLISAHTRHGYPREAIELYTTLHGHGIVPDEFLLLSAVKACAVSGDLSKAIRVHDDAIRFGYASRTLLGNALVDTFAKCKCIDKARLVFDGIVNKDVITWSSMSSCYLNCGFPREALVTFREMGLSGLMPNPTALSSILPACTELKNVKYGREIHGYVIRSGQERNLFVSSALVNMYASCLSMKQAQLMFESTGTQDSVLCNVLMTAFFRNKEFEKGFQLFRTMRSRSFELHCSSWNAVITGCAQNGQDRLALEMLAEMQSSGSIPNHVTIASLIPACTNLENLRKGREIHGYIYRNFLTEKVPTMTGLVLMYAKCGDPKSSRTVFDLIERKDAMAWNTMIVAHSMHGNGKEALLLYHKMLDAGLKPSSVTFTAVLSGCSHSQLVDVALSIFNSMKEYHSLEPSSDQYSCMVDVFSRAGRLEEAYEFITGMPIRPSASAWGALLAACRVYKNVELGRIAAYKLFEIEPENPSNYVLFFNILVTAKLWNEASHVRKMMRERGITKIPGRSWVRIRERLQTFVVGDNSNHQSDAIRRFLGEITEKMRLAGYVPNTDFVLQDLGQDEKEESICNHSEKLAVAFGIMNLHGEKSIRVFKNLRICGDCHNFIKYASKIAAVEIIVRDSLRFHHFSDGRCSCNDFW